MDYSDFLARKTRSVEAVGFDALDLSDRLYPFQRDIVRWALRKGRAAIFADCGMGKTLMQLEWARQVCARTSKRVLILAPLAVGKQTANVESPRFGIPSVYCRKQFLAPDDGIVVTNYEMLPHFNSDDFAGVVLDESSILKAYDGKTRTAIIESFEKTPYKLACTATPAPNDFMELGNHAEFLGVMTRAEMLSMFFVHDGGSTQDWRIKGHAEGEFWKWVCKWAVMIRKPSDLGYDDGPFVLPPLQMHEHRVAVDHVATRKAGLLFATEAHTLQERREARRASIDQRVEIAARIAKNADGPVLLWCALNDEGDAIEKAIEGAVQVAGRHDDEFKEETMTKFAAGEIKALVSKPSICGFGMNFQACADQVFVGLSDSYEQYYQAIRRSWRFGQTRPVNCHIVTSELEGAVVTNIQRKEVDAERMAVAMVASMREEMQRELRGLQRDVTEYVPRASMALPSFVKEQTP